ncbi:MFS transporter [Salmonella enterica subsp. enterica serovar Choleraesuis]|nr:MFS transporter [Salmonella enterica subsp. enterica serovar Choleraesuis]
MTEISENTASIVNPRYSQHATRVMFFIAGFATAAWAALVPFARLNTGVNDGTLGLLLLFLGGGALIAMPLTGIITARLGCRRVLLVSTLLFCLMLPVLSVTGSVWLLALALLLFGVGIGVTDCAMNIQAILVEKDSGRAMMSGFHGFYSVGGIAGAGVMSALMAPGLSPLTSTLIVCVMVVAMLLAAAAGLLPFSDKSSGPAFAIPRGAVLVIGAICFVSFLAEGTVLDWSAIYLTEAKNLPATMGGLGFACFSVTMTLGRLTGDKVVARFGPRRVVLIGALIAACGFVCTIASSSAVLTLIGYLLIGAGCANIVPVMFSAAGRQANMPAAVAVPAVTTLGYLGVLAGPAAIGFVAHHASLDSAFLIVIVLVLIAARASGRVRMS